MVVFFHALCGFKYTQKNYLRRIFLIPRDEFFLSFQSCCCRWLKFTRKCAFFLLLLCNSSTNIDRYYSTFVLNNAPFMMIIFASGQKCFSFVLTRRKMCKRRKMNNANFYEFQLQMFFYSLLWMEIFLMDYDVALIFSYIL